MVTKSNNSKFTCIIPAYNEGVRIQNVLQIVTTMNGLAEVICVDDGSTDNMQKMIKKNFPGVTIVRSEKNIGKSAAVGLGLQKVKTPYVILLDGDLYNLDRTEIEVACEAMSTDSDVDMIVFRRNHDPWFSKIVRGDISLTGERVMRTEDLRNVLATKPERNQLEFAIDLYMQRMKKSVYWMPFSGTNVPKIKKFGYITGMQKELIMHKDMMAYGGIFQTLKSIATFCWHEYPSK